MGLFSNNPSNKSTPSFETEQQREPTLGETRSNILWAAEFYLQKAVGIVNETSQRLNYELDDRFKNAVQAQNEHSVANSNEQSLDVNSIRDSVSQAYINESAVDLAQPRPETPQVFIEDNGDVSYVDTNGKSVYSKQGDFGLGA